jgi:hypothetical protein
MHNFYGWSSENKGMAESKHKITKEMKLLEKTVHYADVDF